jgi:hypothetical protein
MCTHPYIEEEKDAWHAQAMATQINRGEGFAFITLCNASFIELWGRGCNDQSGENEKSSGEDAHGDYCRD